MGNQKITRGRALPVATALSLSFLQLGEGENDFLESWRDLFHGPSSRLIKSSLVLESFGVKMDGD